MNDRAKFKGKIKLRLPLKVRRFIHEMHRGKPASSRSNESSIIRPILHTPDIYHDINPNIEPIIEPNTDEAAADKTS